MDKQTYTEDQIKKLKRNQNIARYSATAVRYNKVFKESAVKQYNEGLSAVEILRVYFILCVSRLFFPNPETVGTLGNHHLGRERDIRS